jgi:predicted nuclease of predicted toxin-antitoxin system
VTVTRATRERPRIRLLWDENLSALVPEALRVLGFRATWVGSSDAGVPSQGSPDGAVIGYAARTNQIIVTSNHDMMTLCHESSQRFVWLDPRGRKLDREAQVLLVFTQIRDWERLLQEHPAMCVHARRTRCAPIASGEAARMALQRMRELRRRERRRQRAVRPQTPGQEHAL